MAQPANPSSTDKLSALLSRLNPVPGFADYTGPYKVGTVDVEIPVSELESPAPAPPNAADIETIQFRIFYPAHPDAQGKRITWLPAPQRDHLSAYVRFLGFGQLLANAISFFPRHLHYTTIPVIKNAPVLKPHTPNNRWPTAIFSHGLGGSRNAYSQIVGTMASHGVVVICPEHRDGSAVASFIRIPSQQNRYFVRSTRRMVPYKRIDHDPTDEVYALRNDQLRIRLWEMGLIHEAVLGIDKRTAFTNLNKSTPSVADFAGKLNVHEPGSIIFGGHSFGSATVVQFLKSVFYAGRPELENMEGQLYSPSRESSIYKQITPRNVTILLDMWCMPLFAPTTKALRDLPLPAYAEPHPSSPSHSSPHIPGGAAILAVESQNFFEWKEHLHAKARLLSPDPAAPKVQASAFYEDIASGVKLPEPHFFYVERSAHLSQSDFGVLFPWLMFKIYKSVEPERALRLNRRAILQVLRENGVPVARTWSGDLVDGVDGGKVSGAAGDAVSVAESGNGGGTGEDEAATANPNAGAASGESGSGGASVRDRGPDDGIHNDTAILDRSRENSIEAWRFIDIIGMGEMVVDDKGAGGAVVTVTDQAVEAEEPGMAGVIEPDATGNVTAGKN
ncbi:PAF acetylhydrolase [Hypoxylon sp. FL0543]|nr:PAF acetylhydrolase [Hypoxylon sp. FL0543]